MSVLLYEVRDHIAYITFNRPHALNCFIPETLVRLSEAWEQVRQDDEVRVAIVTGAGNKAFTAGADLGRLIPLYTHARQPEDEWDHKLMANRQYMNMALLRGYSLYKPVIAAVNGFCIAGGMDFLGATDLRVAVDTAEFGLQEVKWAIIPAGGSLARLPRQIPYCKAMEIMLTGNRISAQEAWRIGLINHVVPPEKLMEKAEELARTIAANGPLAVRKIKEAVEKSSGRPLEEAFRIEDEMQRVVGRSEDAREGPRAFMEKRKPVYKGR
jgi:enoyl-CoA hydratase/carnithine racemase